MDWVLDCSLALAWALPDEASERADRFLAQSPAIGVLWVPAFWISRSSKLRDGRASTLSGCSACNPPRRHLTHLCSKHLWVIRLPWPIRVPVRSLCLWI
jgi:hypothetical protein